MSVRAILSRSLGLPESASDDQIARALADVMHPSWRPVVREAFGQASSPSIVPPRIQASDDPQATFAKLAEQWAKVHDVSLAEGYRQVAKEAPTLYERSRRASYLN